MTTLHENSHKNEAGGCCCPTCGNTCGFHSEHTGEVLISRPIPIALDKPATVIASLEELTNKSDAWRRRLQKQNIT